MSQQGLHFLAHSVLIYVACIQLWLLLMSCSNGPLMAVVQSLQLQRQLQYCTSTALVPAGMWFLVLWPIDGCGAVRAFELAPAVLAAAVPAAVPAGMWFFGVLFGHGM